MVKVMSILEKYNLVEKVNKENIKVENNIDLSEDLKEEDNTVNAKVKENKEEAKMDKPIIKEKSSIKDITVQCEKKLMINEIYNLFGLDNGNINTVFMLQNFINALPQNLPQDVIKQSVMNIINASNIDLKVLLSDGEKRIQALDKVREEYYLQTNKCIVEYKQEIERLSNLISNFQEQIRIKESMLEEQDYLVKYEAQKIDSIIEFFVK